MVARYYAALYGEDAEIIELRALLGSVLRLHLRGSDRPTLLRQVLLAIPGGYARFVELTVRLGSPHSPAFEIVEVGFSPAIGGNQVVVFDPKSVVVIDDR